MPVMPVAQRYKLMNRLIVDVKRACRYVVMILPAVYSIQYMLLLHAFQAIVQGGTWYVLGFDTFC